VAGSSAFGRWRALAESASQACRATEFSEFVGAFDFPGATLSLHRLRSGLGEAAPPSGGCLHAQPLLAFL